MSHPKRPPAKKPSKKRPKPVLPALPRLELDQIATARLNGDKRASLLLQNAVTGLSRTLTMDGANLLELTAHDPDHELLRSDLLGEPLTLALPGGGGRWLYRRGRDVGALEMRGPATMIRLWDITSGTLRAQSGPLARSSGSMDLGGWTRLLARERAVQDAVPGLLVLVPEPGARPHPETTRETPSGSTARSSGTFKRDITVKRFPADGTQRRVIDEALSEAAGLGASRRVQMAVVMAITQESVAGRDTRTTGNDDAGFLQQGLNWISLPNSRNVSKAVRAFLLGPDANVGGNDPSVKGWKQTHGSLRNGAGNLDAMITAVQRPARGGNYAPWEAEAGRTVDAWTGTPTNTRFTRAYTGQTAEPANTATSRPGAWRRGTRDEPESSWASLGRHSAQLGRRRFVALPMSRAPRLVVARDQTLLLAEPHQTLDGLDDSILLSEPSVTLDGIKRAQTLEFDVRADEWETPPGGVVLVREAGIVGGAWLCQTIRQTAGDPIARIILQQATTKPEPVPATSTAGTTRSSSTPSAASPGRTSTPAGIRLDDRWGGTLAVFEQFVHPFMSRFDLRPRSQKRPTRGTSTGGVSEHWVGARTSYATDYPTFRGEAAARALARAMGNAAWQPNRYDRFTVTISGARFTVQILWGSGIEHGDHVHVGMSRA